MEEYKYLTDKDNHFEDNRWCNHQLYNDKGDFVCVYEDGIKSCPYKNDKNGLTAKYYCLDYKPFNEY